MRAVLDRDFLAEAVRLRAFRVRTILALVSSLVALQFLASRRGHFGYSDPEAFRRCSWLLFTALALLTPAAVADAVLAERRGNTLPLVVGSPVGARGFTLGKFLSRTGLVLGAAATAVVPLSLCFLAAGMPLDAGLGFAARTIGLVLEMGALGILASTLASRIETALLLALLLPAVRWVASLTLLNLLARTGILRGPGTAWLGDALAPVSFLESGGLAAPPPAPGMVPGILEPLVTLVLGRADLFYLGVAILVAVPALWISSVLVERLGAGAPRSASPGKPRRRSPAAPWPRLLDRNPVLWKEVRLFRRPVPRLLLLAAFLGLAGAIAWFDLSGVARGIPLWGQTTILAFTAAALGWIAATQGSATFAAERRSGTLETLRASPLPARSILQGKLWGTAFLPLGFWALAMFHVWLLVVQQAIDPVAGLAAAFLTTLYGLVHGALGVRWGMEARNRMEALSGAAFIPLLSLAGFGGLFLVPYLLLAQENESTQKGKRASLYIGSVAIPALLMGPAPWIVATVMDITGDPLYFYGWRHSMFVLLPLAFWIGASVCYLFFLRREIPRLVRTELRKEEDLADAGRDPLPLRIWIERRRLLRHERQALRNPVGKP